MLDESYGISPLKQRCERASSHGFTHLEQESRRRPSGYPHSHALSGRRVGERLGPLLGTGHRDHLSFLEEFRMD